jgi:beta-phosphoglucomutase
MGVIFDLDGVLVDSSEYHLASWRKLGAAVGFQMTDAIFWETFGMPNRQIFPRLLPGTLSDDEAAALSERKESLFREMVHGRIRGLPGAAELPRALRDAGFRLALGSSTPRSNIEVILGALGLAATFDAIVSADDVVHGKPDPEVCRRRGRHRGGAGRPRGRHALHRGDDDPRRRQAGAGRPHRGGAGCTGAG